MVSMSMAADESVNGCGTYACILPGSRGESHLKDAKVSPVLSLYCFPSCEALSLF